MDKEIIKLGDTETKKHNFHRHKSPILIKNVDINKIIEKKGFNILLVTKMVKNRLFAYSPQIKCI